MAARRKKSRSVSTAEPVIINASQFERLTRLVALLVVKGESQTEKIKTLAGTGFTSAEIAEMLGTTANTISVTMYKLRARK